MTFPSPILHHPSTEILPTWLGSASVQAATRSSEAQLSFAGLIISERTTRSVAATIARGSSRLLERSSANTASVSALTVTAAASQSAAGQLEAVESYPEPFRTWASRNSLGHCAACDSELSWLGSFRNGMDTHGKAGRIHCCGIFCHNLVCVKFARFVNHAMQLIEAQQ